MSAFFAYGSYHTTDAGLINPSMFDEVNKTFSPLFADPKSFGKRSTRSDFRYNKIRVFHDVWFLGFFEGFMQKKETPKPLGVSNSNHIGKHTSYGQFNIIVSV